MHYNYPLLFKPSVSVATQPKDCLYGSAYKHIHCTVVYIKKKEMLHCHGITVRFATAGVYNSSSMVVAMLLLNQHYRINLPWVWTGNRAPGSMKVTSQLTINFEKEVRIYASLMEKPLMMGNGKPCSRYEFT